MMTIPHVKLKHTDLVVSRFGFGTMTLGKPMRATSNTILECGTSFWATDCRRVPYPSLFCLGGNF
jgi:hypothetical protein